MKEITVRLGQDTPAYAEFKMTVPDNATNDEIVGMVKDVAYDKSCDLNFDSSFDWTGLRAVEILDESMECIASDVPVEPSGEDMGLVAKSVLTGAVSPLALLQEAERQGVCVNPDVAAIFQEAAKRFDDGGVIKTRLRG